MIAAALKTGAHLDLQEVDPLTGGKQDQAGTDDPNVLRTKETIRNYQDCIIEQHYPNLGAVI